MDPAAAAARQSAEQWMKVAEKLLIARDFEGCREFSSQALAADPRTPGAEDLHTAAGVLLAAQHRRTPNGQPDPYAVLGLDSADPTSRHPDAVHSGYRRLSFLLNRSHSDRSCLLSIAEAARLVAGSWAFLSDRTLKSALDAEFDAAAARMRHRHLDPIQQQRPSPLPQPSPFRGVRAQSHLDPIQQQQPSPLPQPSSFRGARAQPHLDPVQQQQPSPLPQPSPLRAAPQPPAAATVPPVESGTVPSSTFWTVCRACCHIHQYERLYEARKLKCSSCHQPFVAEAMAEPPPIVPGTDMYYCTWGFFPVGFPGCPGFESLVNSRPHGEDQLTANGGVGAENGLPVSAGAEKMPIAPESAMPMKAAPEYVMPLRVNSVKVGAKKRGRPKGSRNKKKE